jgi:hypothetical protein
MRLDLASFALLPPMRPWGAHALALAADGAAKRA